MIVTESFVRRLTISDVQGLDPIRVMLEDIGPGQGRINIECYGQSWASYWGGMGNETIAEFITTCDEHYIAGKLNFRLPPDVFDPDGLKDMLKREVIAERRKGLVSGGYARERYNTIDELDFPDSENELWAMGGLNDLLGVEWWYRLPKKPNPDYQYLCRIIKAVQMALMLEQPA